MTVISLFRNSPEPSKRQSTSACRRVDKNSSTSYKMRKSRRKSAMMATLAFNLTWTEIRSGKKQVCRNKV